MSDLAAYVDTLATAQDTTRVDDGFIELAEKLYRLLQAGVWRNAYLLNAQHGLIEPELLEFHV
ncbi:MAG: hypothetical protein M3P93_12630 [Actinomycetota bacterium]|nr:hypothetical protein [Actinomycetota bacterium]